MDYGKMAQQLVETASQLVRGRTVNIMDTDGVIIASTEKERIGTYHKGAGDAIRTGKPVAIEKDQVGQYPGAKEGYNLPLYSRGKIIGVVGIYGNPSEVYETAQLLGAYTIQFFEQNADWQQQTMENELRGKLLDLLVSLDATDDENASSLLRTLHLRPVFPLRVLIIGVNGTADSMRRLHLFTPLIAQLRTQGFLNPGCDVWGIHGNCLTIVKSRADGLDRDGLKRLWDQLSNLEQACRISAGSYASSYGEIRASYEEALTLDSFEEGFIQDFMDPQCRFRYFMYRSEKRFSLYVQQLYDRLQTALGTRDLPALLETAACYYEQDGSVTRAAELLHIHKNTLQYRLRLLWDALEISGLNGFEREYFLRLCILRHRRSLKQATEGAKTIQE